jgi:SAM-dependent methyltransferase
METPGQAAQRRLHGSSFGPAAADYARFRPRYADAAIRWCLAPAGRDRPRVADVGAGTGILTEALHRLGADAIAVEPDPRMLAELRRQLPDVRAGSGSAEALPLPDGSVDAVLAGQALHWFDLSKALPEIARVLVPGGLLAGLWNIYDDRVSWVAELSEVCGRLGPQTLTRWRTATADSVLARGTELFVPAEAEVFANPRPQDARSLVATLATHSAFLVMPAAESTALLGKVSDFLRQRPETSDGEFTLPMMTIAVRAKLR